MLRVVFCWRSRLEPERGWVWSTGGGRSGEVLGLTGYSLGSPAKWRGAARLGVELKFRLAIGSCGRALDGIGGGGDRWMWL